MLLGSARKYYTVAPQVNKSGSCIGSCHCLWFMLGQIDMSICVPMNCNKIYVQITTIDQTNYSGTNEQVSLNWLTLSQACLNKVYLSCIAYIIAM